ncbi:hypothetical protein [Tenacibaculum agarivorans]|uniref:hypothetical protein n=1 Tax=Tenacibaculum agarivorans TaxID=1908389 RepID=UPI00094B7F74|nr:hypothetical protein [Tenacibaculum agarivorans]
MNWIDKVLPVITLIFGFALSEFGKYFSDRKNERKKLKKLLFNLLELRWLLKQEIDLNKSITQYIERYKNRITEEFGEEFKQEIAEGTEYLRPIMTEILKNSIVKPEKIAEIENNIDSTIAELSEIYPIFAYELNGRFKIKEKLDNIEQYFDTISNQIEQYGEFPSQIKNWIEPKISTELISEFDEYIKAIAKKIGRKTYKNVSVKLEPEDGENANAELDQFIEEYVKEIKKTMPNKLR